MPTVTPAVGDVVAAGLAPLAELTRPALGISAVQYAAIAADALGANTLVAAVAGERIRVVSLVLVASGGANTAQLQSGAGGLALTGAMDLINNGQLVLPYQAAGWCETGAGDLLNLDLSAAALVAGMVGYVMAS